MSWRLTTLDGTGRDNLSSAVASREDALAWAASLAREGARVVRVTGPDGAMIEGRELEALLRGTDRTLRSA